MNASDREAIAQACAKEKSESWDNEATMPLFLRRVPVGEDRPAPWEIDLPAIGMTVYGELPEMAFEEALKSIAEHGRDIARDVDQAARELEEKDSEHTEYGGRTSLRGGIAGAGVAGLPTIA